MKIRLILSMALVFGLSSIAVAVAPVETEVSFLLGYVEKSGCEFYRNGTWHDAKSARAHLHDKYEYLAAFNQINSTEDFIEKVATKSSFSGQAYQVKCNGGTAVSSKQWFSDELTRFRAF